jgi:hypothetical protein
MRECISSTGRLLRMPGKLDGTRSLHIAQDPVGAFAPQVEVCWLLPMSFKAAVGVGLKSC